MPARRFVTLVAVVLPLPACSIVMKHGRRARQGMLLHQLTLAGGCRMLAGKMCGLYFRLAVYLGGSVPVLVLHIDPPEW